MTKSVSRLPYFYMAEIRWKWRKKMAEPFEQSVNIPSTKDPMWNLVKIGRGFWEEEV